MKESDVQQVAKGVTIHILVCSMCHVNTVDVLGTT